jgi:hypothetical protein
MSGSHLTRALRLHQHGNLQEALGAYDDAIAQQPTDPIPLNNRALVLKALGRLDEAQQDYDRCLALEEHPQTRSNRGVLLHEMRQYREALADHDLALAIEPSYAQGHYNRGNTLQALRRLRESVAAYDECLRLAPEFAPAHVNRADALRDLALFPEALHSYDQAVKLAPDIPDARFNRSALLLMLGQLREGFTDYEWRWNRGDLQRHRRSFDKPLWLGAESLAGKTVLLHAEQGWGDTIQFCRYSALVSSLGARVIMECPTPLVGLLQSLEGVDVLVPAGEPLPRFDFHCPLGSLPLAFRTDVDTIPDQSPYLSADPSRISRWKTVLGEKCFRIGICWQGQPSRIDHGRSFPLMMFKAISDVPGVRLISLHKGAGEAQLNNMPPGMTVETLGPGFDEDGAFLDTAAVMKHCDLVITSDTAIAHLAGALGVPVWVALKFVPDWRWMLERSDSPWYPSMRLFRQPRDGDWESVFEEIAKSVRTLNR